MKEIIEDYQRKLKTINEMISIEKDADSLTKLKIKANCFREFINDLQKNLPIVNETVQKNKTELFLEIIRENGNIKNIPYIGNVKNIDMCTVSEILRMIFDRGYLSGIETGAYNKIREIKKVLEINDED